MLGNKGKILVRCVCVFIFLLSLQQGISQVDSTKEKVFSKVEVEASFPGGEAAWNKYIAKGMNNGDFDKFKNSDQGTCRIRFIVGKDGFISNVQAVNMKRTKLAKLAMEIIINSPRWNPAMQDGKAVNAFREQPITFHFEKSK